MTEQHGARDAARDAHDTADAAGEDGYDGPAELIAGDDRIAVTVSLRGHFEPISGSFRWYGRVDATPDVTRLMRDGARAVVLRTPHASVETTLTDVDPWGRPRVEGFGTPPFDVLTELPVTDDAR